MTCGTDMEDTKEIIEDLGESIMSSISGKGIGKVASDTSLPGVMYSGWASFI
jgi:hypothetical protein